MFPRSERDNPNKAAIIDGLISASPNAEEAPDELQAFDKGGKRGRVDAGKQDAERDGQEERADPGHEVNRGRPPKRAI